MFTEPKIKSSYYFNNKGLPKTVEEFYYPKIGKVIYDYIIELAPTMVLEFGTLHGYSAVCIAQALRDLGGNRMLHSYDLWDEYEFSYGSKKRVIEVLQEFDLLSYVNICNGDFNNLTEILKNTPKCDLLHLDVNNDGKIIKKTFDVVKNIPILFEGGSIERDSCWWMKEYSRESIGSIKGYTGYRVLSDSFPSISTMKNNC